MHIDVRVQEKCFDINFEQKRIIEVSNDAGALVLFQGMVREFDCDNQLVQLELHHFPELTEKEIFRIVEIANKRWQLAACTVIHRVGKLVAEDPIVLVIVSSKHRNDAFSAAEFIMDYLKTEAPFWKKESFADGRNEWVKPKSSDQERKKRWNEE